VSADDVSGELASKKLHATTATAVTTKPHRNATEMTSKAFIEELARSVWSPGCVWTGSIMIGLCRP
jgi:hypothetical protein